MTGLLILIAAVFTGFGCYHLTCAFVDVPTAKTSRMMMLARKQTGTGEEKLFDVYLTKIAEKLSFLLRLDPIKRTRLELTLNIAGIPLSPESYTMKAFLTAAATALCGLPFPLVLTVIIGGLAFQDAVMPVRELNKKVHVRKHERIQRMAEHLADRENLQTGLLGKNLCYQILQPVPYFLCHPVAFFFIHGRL